MCVLEGRHNSAVPTTRGRPLQTCPQEKNQKCPTQLAIIFPVTDPRENGGKGNMWGGGGIGAGAGWGNGVRNTHVKAHVNVVSPNALTLTYTLPHRLTYMLTR